MKEGLTQNKQTVQWRERSTQEGVESIITMYPIGTWLVAHVYSRTHWRSAKERPSILSQGLNAVVTTVIVV